MAVPTHVDWAAARAAVAANAPRVSALVRSIKKPTAAGTGEWDVNDVAIHISHGLNAVRAMAEGGGGLLDEVWDLPKLTGAMLAGERDRSLATVADRIDEGAAKFLAVMEAAEGDTERAWIVKRTALPMSSLTCHVLNELIVHGYDIAKAERVPWPIGRSDASLVVMGFLFPSLNALGRQMVNERTAAGVRAVYDVRLRGGGGRAYLRFDDGDFSIHAERPGRVDCHLLVDPAAFLLVAWNRMSQWRGIARGQLLAWGRKPWLGLKMRSLLKNP